MLRKHFNCFIRWMLRWFRLHKLLQLAGKLFSMLSRPLCRGSAQKIASYFGLVKNSCGLITLPQEVLEMILADLDWKDVLNVRVTCKLLCTAFRSRSVWRAQYQRVSDSYDTPLNAKDRTATYTELERDTLHWARLQHSWGSRPKPPTQRLLCECSAVQIHLVHGGRWLLASTDYPCLELYDLDSLNGRRRILIRSQDKHDEQVRTFVVDEVRMTPPNVDMFIALNHCEITDEPLMRISIWRITSGPDDHTLLAHHITSFNTYTTGVCVDMDLRGDYLATNGRSPNHIDIYDWRRSSSLVHHKATIALGQKNAVKSIRILSGQRILTFEWGVVRIYAVDASKFRPIPGRQPVVAPLTMPLHTLHLPGMDPYLLCPLHLDRLGTASLYLACAHAVVKLTVPYDDQPLIVADCLAYNEGRPWTWAITLHRAYFRKGTTATAVLLARGFDENCTQVWDIVDRNYDAGPLVDDYSGRIVERARMNYKIVVFLRSVS
ncbi:hypothetical protein PTI98_000282 [Pleurotus ostreatus]|nr:hypothetical protein PTI98_000282 [Pleurotus ostreatus]